MAATKRSLICGQMLQLCARPASTPPFGESSKISNSLRASDLAWLPPTLDSNCSERLWLHARTILVALENYSGWPGELSWLARGVVMKQLRTCLTYASLTYTSSLPMPPLFPQLPMKFGNIVRVETSRYLTKITTLRRKAGSCSQAYGFTTITMYNWWQPSEIGCA